MEKQSDTMHSNAVHFPERRLLLGGEASKKAIKVGYHALVLLNDLVAKLALRITTSDNPRLTF